MARIALAALLLLPGPLLAQGACRPDERGASCAEGTIWDGGAQKCVPIVA